MSHDWKISKIQYQTLKMHVKLLQIVYQEQFIHVKKMSTKKKLNK